MTEAKTETTSARRTETPPEAAHEPVESVEGGGGGHRLADGVRPRVDLPKPRGLLPVPSEVDEVVRTEEARLLDERSLVPTADARRRLTDEQCLDHFFRDEWVSYRETPRGIDVLAVGLDEIGHLMERLNGEELLTVRTRQI